MSRTATLRQSGGSVILSIPKAIAESMAVGTGSVVELTVQGRTLSVVPARRGLAERLADSPKTPAHWHRDEEWLQDGPVGREVV
jgi:antitoxin ChpS